MTPPLSSRRRGTVRILLFIVIVVALSAAAWSTRSLGRLLHHEDPLTRADAVIVSGGKLLERVVEAGDLFAEGYAPLVVLCQQLPDYGEIALRRRGFDGLGETDIQIRALTLMGVPRHAIHVVEPQVATASEAAAIRALAVDRRWQRVIVVTNKLHTARARLVIQRHLAGTPTQVVMRGTRYDPADLDGWWRSRADLRFALLEAQKIVLYWTGIAD